MDQILHRLAGIESEPLYYLGEYEQQIATARDAAEASHVVRRLWARDGHLWQQGDLAKAEIENRLGWLNLPEQMAIQVARLRALAEDVRAAGIERVVLLGMGGSSLAPEVMRLILGRGPSYPDLVVLDSTDPAQIRRIQQGASLARSLFVVSSKSGSTIETDTLYAYFREGLDREVGSEKAGQHLIAITDPGTSLAQLAHRDGFRAIYTNPPDIGGRYSALSLFGLVPAALIGLDLDRLLDSSQAMAYACRAAAPAVHNPGLMLGLVMGELAARPSPGRDKLTLLTSPQLAPFGPWVEQLVAESTGKNGVGILPVEGEPLPDAPRYGRDRLFAYLRLAGADNEQMDRHVAELVALGHPVIVMPWVDIYDLGAEFFRWELATAIAGQRMRINPFDQPNVEAAKRRARTVLASYEQTGALPAEEPSVVEGRLSFFGGAPGSVPAAQYVRAFWAQARPQDYVAIMAYVDRREDYEATLQEIRGLIGERLGLAVTLGFGPRFLHSTGQLHKGGPDTGLFLQIRHDEPNDVAIPGRRYTFGVLELAQALGDERALRQQQRRVLAVHVGTDVSQGLSELLDFLSKSL